MSASAAKKELRKYVNQEKKAFYPNFFKSAPGEYGEGDVFLGVVVPDVRKVAKKFKDMSQTETRKLLKSKFHEERMCGLFIVVHQFEKGDAKTKDSVVRFYQKNLAAVNNWDLVDLTAPKVLGPHYLNRNKEQLYIWAKSKDLWKRRIAILTTFHFIRDKKFSDTLKLSRILLNDEEDLIHKAVGWMLREIGNRDLKVEEAFLKKHYQKMPRTMLRYAIEKFPERKRQAYLKGKI